MLAVTVAAFNFRGINHYSIKFEQVKCTILGSYAVTVLISGESIQPYRQDSLHDPNSWEL